MEDIHNNVSQIGHSSDGTSQVYLHLNLMNKGLDSIAYLNGYEQLQVADISYNQLTDLTSLQKLRSLISLNASNNKLVEILPAISLQQIREMNFSSNNIISIGDLSHFPLLNTLLLDYNGIETIEGLSKCTRLKHLSVSHNRITHISGLENLPIRQLDLSHNLIKKIENTQSLKNIQYINLSNNQIKSLRALQGHEILEEIHLENNEILDLAEICSLKELRKLRILQLNGNPIQNIGNYRAAILYRLPVLVSLDGMVVDPEVKVAAMGSFSASQESLAMRDHMFNVMRSYQQPITLLESALASSDPYPILVITGPFGIGKKQLAQQLCNDFPTYFGRCLSHTTKDEAIGPSDVASYHAVSKEDFKVKREQGYFSETCMVHNEYYGVSYDEIESVAKQGLACVLTMNLQGVMTFKKKQFKPRFILVLPENSQIFEKQLVSAHCLSEVQEIQQEIERFVNFHQNHPGYFDIAIVSDSVDKMYMQLKNAVSNYLGFTPPSTANPPATYCDSPKTKSRMLLDSTPTLVKSKDSFDIISRLSPATVASYERRYDKTTSLVCGSDLSDELNIKTPISNVPYIRGCANLISPNYKSSTVKTKLTTTETSQMRPFRSLDIDSKMDDSMISPLKRDNNDNCGTLELHVHN